MEKEEEVVMEWVEVELGSEVEEEEVVMKRMEEVEVELGSVVEEEEEEVEEVLADLQTKQQQTPVVGEMEALLIRWSSRVEDHSGDTKTSTRAPGRRS